MATAAQLKKLRKKYKLGEFKPGAKRNRKLAPKKGKHLKKSSSVLYRKARTALKSAQSDLLGAIKAGLYLPNGMLSSVQAALKSVQPPPIRQSDRENPNIPAGNTNFVPDTYHPSTFFPPQHAPG